MLDLVKIKKEYECKLFYLPPGDTRIYVKEFIFYPGQGKYRIIYEEGLGQTKYLNDLDETEFLKFIENLIIYEKPKEQIIMDTKKIIINNYDQVNNISKLNDMLYRIVNDLYIDKISIEKAIAISKVSQTILNIEKIKNVSI